MTIDDQVAMFINKNPRATMTEVTAKRIEIVRGRRRFFADLIGEPSTQFGNLPISRGLKP